AVFMPILFLGGITGRLFREFGLVIAGAVVISSFIALTLTPMLSTKLLKPRQGHSWFYYKTEPFFKNLTEGYRSTLYGFMTRRWLAFTILVVTLGLIVLFVQVLPEELVPMEDRGNVRLSASAPEGATFEYMD